MPAVLTSLPAPLFRPRLALPLRAGGDEALLGILLVLGSTIFFSGSDSLSKSLAGSLPGIEIAWLRYAGFTAIMVVLGLASPDRRLPRSTRPGLQILRAIGLVGSAVLFIASLRYLPVAQSTAISFVSPLFVTALSIPFLGEKIGIRRWAAASVGFAGVLIIIRPGTGAFETASLLPVASALFWAMAIIATRKIGRGDPSRTTMTYSALVGFVILSLLVPAVWIAPRWDQVLVGAGIGVVSTIGHWIVTLAYRHADASVLIPFSYTQIIWATLLGVLAFGNIPDGWTLAGAAVVIGSGLYTAHRERVRRDPSSAVLPAAPPKA